MARFEIGEVTVGNGTLGISGIPGRGGAYESDLARIVKWEPSLVLTMVTAHELRHVEAETFGADLEAADIAWRHLPIPDFGAPPLDTAALWPDVSQLAHGILKDGGKVLAHCFGGCGRSGMAVLRLMVEAGEDANPALERLRQARPCAVERETQLAWASVPMFERKGWIR